MYMYNSEMLYLTNAAIPFAFENKPIPSLKDDNLDSFKSFQL